MKVTGAEPVKQCSQASCCIVYLKKPQSLFVTLKCHQSPEESWNLLDITDEVRAVRFFTLARGEISLERTKRELYKDIFAISIFTPSHQGDLFSINHVGATPTYPKRHSQRTDYKKKHHLNTAVHDS
ncbi:hypothetical protein CEXT_346011 [Caerostris extrusa]|uniref:Uncharacterized protein n=1 Tax=Caerostris extrusa TaxID=172846 RepID=A0AAV4UWF2_CAEEX|nr:hypothetical protein CEXT_346011 [Caerostris extrusa]